VGTIIADPHEIANVCGEAGLNFMYEDKTELRVYYMLPSCVPATPFEHSGAVLDSEECKRLWASGRFLGLGEMMNYPGVVGCDEDVLAKLDIADKIDGHVPMLSGKELQAYICGGIGNDHECGTAEEALEKVSLGMNIFIREGTGAKNLSELIKAVNPYNMHRFAFCTDDKHIDDVLKEGTISHCIAKAISLGMDAVTAFTLGTHNAAVFYGLKGVGAIAPGYRADIVVMSEPNPDTIEEVYLAGELYKGESTAPSVDTSRVTNTVNIKPVTARELAPVIEDSSKIPFIKAVQDSLVTKLGYTDDISGLMLCANIERHKASGNVGTSYLSGFCIKGGAVAQTIGHDSHNITVMGDNTEDMALAVNSLGSSGGIAVVKNGELLATLTLEVAGLMSARPYEEVLSEYTEVTEAVKQISNDPAPALLMILSFLSLLVIPEIKISDRGLFDVGKFYFLQ
jgi:adenine deaminase